jgi:ssDNA-binding Zn-finger/Zn-ribbon topoisomerase 1
MKLKTKKRLFEFNEYFKTPEDFINFINWDAHYINIEILRDRIVNLYYELIIIDEAIKLSILNWFVIEKLNFKNKSIYKLEFWLERGKDLNDYNRWLFKKDGIGPIKPLDYGNINKFKYGKFKFKLNDKPKCRICDSNLNVEIIRDTYNILGCSNNDCESNKNTHISTIRQLAFLPEKVFHEKNKRVNVNSKLTKEYWLLRGYSLENSKAQINKIKNLVKFVPKQSFDYYKITTDMSDEEIKLFHSLNSKLCLDYWLNKGFSQYEAKKKISEHQSNAAKHVDFEKRLLPSNLEYWLNKGYSKEESKVKVSENQTTFSLEKCIEKYGEDEGLKRFTDRQNKWLNSLITNGNMVIGYSKISQELFYKLLETYEINDRNKIYFATHNKEFRLNKTEGGLWLYDFTDLKNKKIIEYNGDDYHANPKKYLAEDYPNPFKKDITAQEIWDKDSKKINMAKKNGFEVMVIWDSEYRWGNKKKVINKCLEFLDKK